MRSPLWGGDIRKTELTVEKGGRVWNKVRLAHLGATET